MSFDPAMGAIEEPIIMSQIDDVLDDENQTIVDPSVVPQDPEDGNGAAIEIP